uniref:ZP domain-containing protein n=1 Tax=Acrobeloides nanus TaxID=290746 RepID=A0A914D127_9BILA
MLAVIIFVAIIVETIAIPIDNQLIGEPTVRCESDALSIDLQTMKQFNGRVFVKGYSRDSSCLRNGNSSSKFNFSINFDTCGIRRTREFNGVSISATVIVSFHPIFITKVDRAYRLNCFYVEARKTVAQQLEINELTTQLLQHQTSMPTCRYEILTNGPTGAPVRYAKIGDHVYHKWSCEVDTPDMYCMRVHTCSVNDGQGGEQVLVLDQDGCQVDRYVLQNLEYSSDLVAGQGAHVFKFADKPTLHFNCQIEISVKQAPNGCKDSQPQCTGADFVTSNTVNANNPSGYSNENIESASSSENIYQAKNNRPQPATRINEYGQQRLLPSAQFRTNNNNHTKSSSSYGTFDSGYPSKPSTAFGGYENPWTTLGPQVQTQVVPSQKTAEIGYDEVVTQNPRAPAKSPSSSGSSAAAVHPPGIVPPPEAIPSRNTQQEEEFDTGLPFTTIAYGNSITSSYVKKKTIAKRDEDRNKRENVKKVADVDLPEQSFVVIELDEDPNAVQFLRHEAANTSDLYCISSALFATATFLALISMTLLGVFIFLSIRRHKENVLRKIPTH